MPPIPVLLRSLEPVLEWVAIDFLWKKAIPWIWMQVEPMIIPGLIYVARKQGRAKVEEWLHEYRDKHLNAHRRATVESQ